MSLGQRIRHLRQSRGLTQSELGGRELSKSFISLLEKDRAQPSLETILLLARRLDASVDSLLGHAGNVPEVVANGLLALSREAIRLQQFERAAKLLDAVRLVAEGLDEVGREADLQEAELAVVQRRFDDVWPKLVAAAESNERAGDPWRLGRAHLQMGWFKLRRREFPEAERLLHRALSILRTARAGRDPARVEALIALGGTLVYMGKFSSALAQYEEAARADAAQHDPRLRAHALWGMGLAYRKLGDHGSARTHLLAAKDVLESMEDVPDYARVLKEVGQLDYAQGHARDALRHFHHALRVAERLKMRIIHASVQTEIARANLSLDNVEEAEHFARQALAEAKEIDERVEAAEASWVLAKVLLQRKDHAAAIKLYKDALAGFTERKMSAKAGEVARELGLLLRERGAHAQAAGYLARSLEEDTKEPDVESLAIEL